MILDTTNILNMFKEDISIFLHFHILSFFPPKMFKLGNLTCTSVYLCFMFSRCCCFLFLSACCSYLSDSVFVGANFCVCCKRHLSRRQLSAALAPAEDDPLCRPSPAIWASERVCVFSFIYSGMHAKRGGVCVAELLIAGREQKQKQKKKQGVETAN